MQSLAGSIVGVTSHITPLPTGEGKGEGPAGVGGEASVFSVCRRRSVSSKQCAKRVC